MHLAQCEVSHRVEPPLDETDHLWQECFKHEPPPGVQESSYSSGYIHMEKFEGGGGGGKGGGTMRAAGEAIVRIPGA